MTLQEALDYVSLNLYNRYFDTLKHRQPDAVVIGVLESAAELYAESKAKEAFEAARLVERVYGGYGFIHPDYETYKTKQNA